MRRPQPPRHVRRSAPPVSTGLDGPQPGDLVFFSDDGTYFPHVGIYTTHGRMFNAARSDTTLRYDPLRNNYHGAVRFTTFSDVG